MQFHFFWCCTINFSLFLCSWKTWWNKKKKLTRSELAIACRLPSFNFFAAVILWSFPTLKKGFKFNKFPLQTCSRSGKRFSSDSKRCERPVFQIFSTLARRKLSIYLYVTGIVLFLECVPLCLFVLFFFLHNLWRTLIIHIASGVRTRIKVSLSF